MPRARNRADSPHEVAEPVQEPAEGQGLQSQEPVTWRAGKAIPVSDLLRRLKTLAEELATIDQDGSTRETLVPKAQELASVQLLGHKDKGVRAWTLQCIVEMFRLLAPDAPYKSGQLKQIFEIFISVTVPALGRLSDPYTQQHLSVLHSLSNVKSIVLLADIPGSDNLILTLFANCFDVTSEHTEGEHREQLSKNVDLHLTGLLCTLIEECDSLPNGVTDVILAQFLRADPSMLANGKKGEALRSVEVLEHSPAYLMARSICTTCADKMTRAVGEYFSSVLIDTSENLGASRPSKSKGRKRTHDESEDESEDGLVAPVSTSQLEEIEKAHRLLRELWRASPDVIRGVVSQIEAEVNAEDAHLRTMAVQTIGDMVAGIGAAGPPPAASLDPAAYPSQSLVASGGLQDVKNILLTPAAPLPFASMYPSAYQAFINSSRDKPAQVRAAWATAAGRIIRTSGGGKGLDPDQESQLLRQLSEMLIDSEEKVRLAAVQAIAQLEFPLLVEKLGARGGVEAPGFLLGNLADRIKDRKHAVRVAAMELLGRIWGVAAGAIAEGSDRVCEMLGAIPTKILMAFYINDPEVNALVQRVLFESLLPIGFPPIQPKPLIKGDPQRISDSQVATDLSADPDAIRAERILVLVRGLEDKAKAVFFYLQSIQNQRAKYLEKFFEEADDLFLAEHPPKQEGDQQAKQDAKPMKEVRKKLDFIIEALCKQMPNPDVAIKHMNRFAAFHHRRSYQLIKFCYAPASDYSKIVKAMKELTKHLKEAPSAEGMAVTLETLVPLVRSASMLVYNRSHVPAIMEIARLDDKGLGNAAREVLNEISTKVPDVFKVHVRELCEALRKQAPTPTSPNDPTAVATLKACAGFAQRFPDEMPKDRDFYEAMTAFAKHGTPPEAAKHAVTVIVASAEKKEMNIKDISRYCIREFSFGAESYLSRLAALSQLRFVANEETKEQDDAIVSIAIHDILTQVRTEADDTDPDWMDEIDDDLCAKLWALKILVNGLRGMPTATNEGKEALEQAQKPVYRLLNTLVNDEGQLSKAGKTAKHHKARLRLAAATQLLKLSCDRALDHFLTPHDFNRLVRIAQDPLPEVRAGFVKTLKKYLGQKKLPNRFYGLVFMYAFEPSKAAKEATMTWLKSRANISANHKDTVMTSAFARFLSLLAHHQDFSREPDELEDFVGYIMFYLKAVATQENLPLIYHLAQRLKTAADGIDPEKSENLYTLSDLAEAVIRLYQEACGWSLQLQGAKVRLPADIFAALPNHDIAQEISETRYLPDELVEKLDELVKDSLKTKKRKSDGSSHQAAKKARTIIKSETKKEPRARKGPKPAKTPKKETRLEDRDGGVVSERRKSTRSSRAKNYAEDDDSEDEREMNRWQEKDDEGDDGSNKENVGLEPTTPTSDPTPAPSPIATAVVPEKPQKATKKSAHRAAPQRATRAKSKQNGRKKDVMDVPSDSDEQLSDVPEAEL